MDIINNIVHWVQLNFLQIGAIVIIVDNLLFAVAPLTPWKWDDTLASRLQDIIKKVFPTLVK